MDMLHRKPVRVCPNVVGGGMWWYVPEIVQHLSVTLKLSTNAKRLYAVEYSGKR